jgi:mannosyltransferase OCH1-like enzyme
MIPKKIHQIWIGPYNIPRREKLCIEKIKIYQSDFEYKLWNNDNLPEIPKEIKDIYDFLGERKDYVHQADILRMFLINKFGGVYMDVDFEFISGLTKFELEKYKAFFCTHYGDVDTYPNGIFGMEANHPISNFLLKDAIESFPKRYWYGPSWLGQSIKEYFGINGIISHEKLAERYFEPNNIFHINYDYFHHNHYYHHALYSWSPEVIRKFENGEMK